MMQSSFPSQHHAHWSVRQTPSSMISGAPLLPPFHKHLETVHRTSSLGPSSGIPTTKSFLRASTWHPGSTAIGCESARSPSFPTPNLPAVPHQLPSLFTPHASPSGLPRMRPPHRAEHGLPNILSNTHTKTHRSSRLEPYAVHWPQHVAPYQERPQPTSVFTSATATLVPSSDPYLYEQHYVHYHEPAISPLASVSQSPDTPDQSKESMDLLSRSDLELIRSKKRARRKEQCRVNQANYRKRKQANELRLAEDVQSLKCEIQALMKQREEWLCCPHVARKGKSKDKCGDRGKHETMEDSPEQEIAAFYFALQEAAHKPTHSPADHSPADQTQGRDITATMATMLALQQEEFATVRQLQQQWLAHIDRLDDFTLVAVSSERLEAGDQVIVKIGANLRVSIPHEVDFKLACLLGTTLQCSVQQRFEFHNQQQTVTRVTSEVDWASGLIGAARMDRNQALRLLGALQSDHQQLDLSAPMKSCTMKEERIL